MAVRAKAGIREVTMIMKEGEHEKRVIPKLLFYPNHLHNLLNIYIIYCTLSGEDEEM